MFYFFFGDRRMRLEDHKKWREIQLVQKYCPHEYKTVYVKPETSNNYERYDLYCPICEKMRYDVSKRERETLLNIQKEREAYWGKRHDCRAGDI